jgi:hypothetical protein
LPTLWNAIQMKLVIGLALVGNSRRWSTAHALQDSASAATAALASSLMPSLHNPVSSHPFLFLGRRSRRVVPKMSLNRAHEIARRIIDWCSVNKEYSCGIGCARVLTFEDN